MRGESVADAGEGDAAARGGREAGAGRGADAPTGHARPGRIPTRASHRVTRDRLVRRALVARVTSWRVQPWPHRLEECLNSAAPAPAVCFLTRLVCSTHPEHMPHFLPTTLAILLARLPPDLRHPDPLRCSPSSFSPSDAIVRPCGLSVRLNSVTIHPFHRIPTCEPGEFSPPPGFSPRQCRI